MKVKSESEVAQSCPTLRDPMDCSLPGSSVHGIFQARVLEWGAIAFSATLAYFLLIHFFVLYLMLGLLSLFHFLINFINVCYAMLSSFSHVRLCATVWTAAHRAPPSTGFSRQE